MVILKVDDNLEIHGDAYQYIVVVGGVNKYYYSDLVVAVEEILHIKLKERLSSARRKDVEGVLNTLKRFELWVEKTFEPLSTRTVAKELAKSKVKK